MFAKIFTQIFDSSIVEQPDVRFTFMDLLVLCDCNGVVDMTHEAIARRTNRPIEVVRSSIATLEAPDTRSRTPEADGRRLIRLDEHRDWGWFIVNYDRFRMTASEEQRREKTRDRVQRHRTAVKNPNEKAQSEPCNAPVTQCNASVTPSNACNAMQKQKQKQKDKTLTPLPTVAECEMIWESYPRKAGKQPAMKAIAKALRTTNAETLLKAVQGFAEARAGQDEQYTPHAATWFNQQRYLDDPATWAAKPVTGKPTAVFHLSQ